MRHYSISVEVPLGSGDYGSGFLTVVNNQPTTKRQAIKTAKQIATDRNSRTLVFVGQAIGKLVYDSKENSDVL